MNTLVESLQYSHYDPQEPILLDLMVWERLDDREFTRHYNQKVKRIHFGGLVMFANYLVENGWEVEKVRAPMWTELGPDKEVHWNNWSMMLFCRVDNEKLKVELHVVPPNTRHNDSTIQWTCYDESVLVIENVVNSRRKLLS